MSALGSLRRASAAQSRGRQRAIGAAAALLWLALVALSVWLGGGVPALGVLGWLVWLTGTLAPLGLIWLGVRSAHGLAALRDEADALRASLRELRTDRGPAVSGAVRVPPPPRPRPAPEVVPAGADPAPAPAPELTPTELYLALNFPDGPDDHEAVRCLRLALTDPQLSRLIRAGQDVVTLLAGRGVYMDDLPLADPDPDLWQRFARGERGTTVAALASVGDATALATAARMMGEDAVFRDAAHHFLRHFDRMLNQRAETDAAVILAALADSRSGRAFTLLAQASGVLGAADMPADADAG